MFAPELAALKQEAFDLDLLGFDDAEPDRLLATPLGPNDAADEGRPSHPPIRQPTSSTTTGNNARKVVVINTPRSFRRSYLVRE
jgi:hypothetical protein